MSDNGSNGGNFATCIVIAFMCYLLVPHKNNKERKTSKEGQRKENYNGEGCSKKRKEGSSSISVKRRLVVKGSSNSISVKKRINYKFICSSIKKTSCKFSF